jgi:hypothetical protein
MHLFLGEQYWERQCETSLPMEREPQTALPIETYQRRCRRLFRSRRWRCSYRSRFHRKQPLRNDIAAKHAYSNSSRPPSRPPSCPTRKLTAGMWVRVKKKRRIKTPSTCDPQNKLGATPSRALRPELVGVRGRKRAQPPSRARLWRDESFSPHPPKSALPLQNPPPRRCRS